jgi:aerobic-type carbon monoxide dehydrogenase small subunit (CoxS/CutS family)
MSDDATTDAGADEGGPDFGPRFGAPAAPDEHDPAVWRPLPRAEAYDSDQTMHVSFAAQPAPGGPDPLAAPGGQLPPDWQRAEWHVPAAADDPTDAAESGEYTLGTYTTPWQPPAPDTAGFPAGWGPPPGTGPEPAGQPDAHGRAEAAGTDAPWDAATPAPPAGHADPAWHEGGAGWDGPGADVPPPPGWVDVPPPRDGAEYARPEPAAPTAPTAPGGHVPGDAAAPAYEAGAAPAPEAPAEVHATADGTLAGAGTPAGGTPADRALPAGNAAGDGEAPAAGAAPAAAGAESAAEDAQDGQNAQAAEDAEDAEDDDEEPPARTGDHPLVSYTLHVNGADRPVTGAWLGESLLYVLRERLGLAGAKDGCEQGECGACSVQVDGRLVASCLVPAAVTEGSEIRTVEGLSGPEGEPSDVQRALADRGAVQCGFCVPGLAMTVHDLLEGNHDPSELEARAAVSGNLCRCSGYRGVLAAVRQVVGERAERQQAPPGNVPAGQPGADARIPPQATDSPDGGPR